MVVRWGGILGVALVVAAVSVAATRAMGVRFILIDRGDRIPDGAARQDADGRADTRSFARAGDRHAGPAGRDAASPADDTDGFGHGRRVMPGPLADDGRATIMASFWSGTRPALAATWIGIAGSEAGYRRIGRAVDGDRPDPVALVPAIGSNSQYGRHFAAVDRFLQPAPDGTGMARYGVDPAFVFTQSERHDDSATGIPGRHAGYDNWVDGLIASPLDYLSDGGRGRDDRIILDQPFLSVTGGTDHSIGDALFSVTSFAGTGPAASLPDGGSSDRGPQVDIFDLVQDWRQAPGEAGFHLATLNAVLPDRGSDFRSSLYGPFATGAVDDEMTPLSAVPEPQNWALMIFGFGAIGATVRRRGRLALSHA